MNFKLPRIYHFLTSASMGVFLFGCTPESANNIYEICDITNSKVTLSNGQKVSVRGKVSANLSLFEKGTYAVEENECKIRVYYLNSEAPVSGTYVQITGTLKEPFSVGNYRRQYINEDKRKTIPLN